MKTLFIVRHGEASWDSPELSDYKRPLLKEEINISKTVANYLCEKKIIVNKIISSSAVRAMETAKVSAPIINFPKGKIEIMKELYLAELNEIFDVLYAIDDEFDSVMIFGHNPGLTELANAFLDKIVDNLPTTAVVSVKINNEKWTDISVSEYSTNFIVFPEMLKR